MRMPTAILQEEYERRWTREQERMIDAYRRARAQDWAWVRWRRRLLWTGCGALGFASLVFAIWMAS